MKEINLSRGKITIVDDADFDYLNQWRWKLSSTGYAVRAYMVNGKTTRVRMHRLITNADKTKEVDHINGNSLDNRRSNLRTCSHAENNQNKGKQSNNTSGYKGVMWDKGTGRWRAKIAKDGKDIHVGRFDDLVEAAKAYDMAALEVHGEFASLNFPPQEQHIGR
jgi:hypothetical protein